MEDLGADEESARAVADAEANHLDEGQDDSEDVERGDEDFNESDEQERDDDDPLALHHESSPSVFLEELA